MKMYAYMLVAVISVISSVEAEERGKELDDVLDDIDDILLTYDDYESSDAGNHSTYFRLSLKSS